MYTAEGFWHDGLVPHESEPNVFAQAAPPAFIPSLAMRFYPCPFKHNCRVDERNGSVACAQHSSGVLCATCAHGFTVDASLHQCAPCPSSALVVIWKWLLLVAAVVTLAIFWVKIGAHWCEKFRRQRLNGRDLGLVVLLKLGLGFFQVILLQPDAYGIRFPALYTDFLASFQWLTFEPPFTTFECWMPNNYHDRLATAVVFAALIMSVLLLGFLRTKAGGTKNNGHMLALCIVPSYLLYPSTSTVLFNTLNCRQIDEVSYLTQDLSINCDSAAHKTAKGVAMFGICMFSLGLPAMYQALLYPHRHKLASSAAHEESPSVAGGGGGSTETFHALKFLYQDYKPEFYYWEAVEIFRKLLLTGALVQFQKGSLIQIVVAMGVIIMHMLVLAHYKPYRQAVHGALAQGVYGLLLVIFFGGLLLSAKTALPKDHVLRKGISTNMVAGFLIFSVVAVVVMTVMTALSEIRAAAGYPVLQHRNMDGRTKRAVVFEHYPDPARFHLFLSHVWATGQDQVLSIKKELLLIVPTLKIWLDVEVRATSALPFAVLTHIGCCCVHHAEPGEYRRPGGQHHEH
jgi:hypothetical protein